MAALTVDQVHTSAAVFAGDAGAIIDVGLASVAAVTGLAFAAKAVSGSDAGGSVSAGTRGTWVGFYRAIGAHVAWRADADVACGSRLASPSVLARLVGAGQSSGFASSTFVPRGAST